MNARIGGATLVAGVVGSPVKHSLSPLIHNAWLQGSDIDGVYVAFPLAKDGLRALVNGFRGGVIRGLNVTVPFKEEALALADRASRQAQDAGAANLLLFHPDGTMSADNTDGVGLLAAFAEQAPNLVLRDRTAVVLGAGGAACGRGGGPVGGWGRRSAAGQSNPRSRRSYSNRARPTDSRV